MRNFRATALARSPQRERFFTTLIGCQSSCRHTDPAMLYIFKITMRPGHRAEDYAEAWVRASEIIQRAPGALGTRLHRKLDDPDTLLAIARWTSKDARDAMETRPSDEVRRIIASQAPFVEIEMIGEFDEPEWVVNPPQGAETRP